jgi:hypothetical protein
MRLLSADYFLLKVMVAQTSKNEFKI